MGDHLEAGDQFDAWLWPVQARPTSAASLEATAVLPRDLALTNLMEGARRSMPAKLRNP